MWVELRFKIIWNLLKYVLFRSIRLVIGVPGTLRDGGPVGSELQSVVDGAKACMQPLQADCYINCVQSNKKYKVNIS